MAPRTPRKHCLCSDSKRQLQSSPTRTPCAGRPSLDCWRSAFSPCKTGWTTLTSSLQHLSQSPNNSFKPDLLSYTKAMAETTCHSFGATNHVAERESTRLNYN